MHLVVYDATGHGRQRVQPFLTASWRYGSALYKLHPQQRVDDVYGATSWEDALAWLCSVRPREKIESIQYWGHGLFGRVLVANDVLDAAAFVAGHARHDDLVTLRTRIASERSLIWFRTCATFGRAEGQAFASVVANFFGCRAAGHTFVIGPLQSGLHSLAPGETPSWPVDEGGGTATTAAMSSWTAPHTITCLHGAVPEGW